MTANPGSAPQSTTASVAELLHTPVGVPGRFKGNFDYQFVRTMRWVAHDRAAIGECYETGSRIADENAESNSESWSVKAQGIGAQ